VPSELAPLKLADIDWERGRLRITSPKTADCGKGERWIPLFPELRLHVEAAFETAVEGEVYLVRHPCLRQRGANKVLRAAMLSLLRKAGVSPWPRLFQNLRASRETELAADYPLHVVCAWIGNTNSITMRHYLQVTDADYRKAAGAESGAPSGAVSGAVSECRRPTANDETYEKPVKSQQLSPTDMVGQKEQVYRPGTIPVILPYQKSEPRA
jgi:hypothetical protein